ncbi:hypothetical protein P170DRAFT_480522 [Aspergillus steynii IBT 23096]|uniref:Uncharacterized protein n=1 Tax=Aspergillus steynii IBT 23096 TaxID=1392250 RepID=A0A2I2FSF3_9EURO|nr:uncharacterized protein P170DRAFT_480522 [Aspergillus steynii IBT 23096]PLB43552.1 hypothetical protein P170DRAFT_480522 [Aspergillus steynii IBT 23096]
MRLRSSIRPPKRFNSEDYEAPFSQVSLRRPQKDIERPPIIEFNPNLPPAAFPTLDKPRVPGSNDGNIDTPQDDLDSEVDFDDITFAEIENLKASNGPLNPIYVRNMNLMANAGRPSSHTDHDVEDTAWGSIFDDFDQEFPLASESMTLPPILTQWPQPGTDPLLTMPNKPAPLIPDPEWSDMPISLRVEIFSNLLESLSWPQACNQLGLNVQDQIQLQKKWAERDKQVDDEDELLAEMRAQQLRESMRVDNSSPNHDLKSLQTRMQEIGDDAISRLRRRPQAKHLMCNTDDIAIARRFLDKQGLNPRLIGEWSNSIPVVEGYKEGENDNHWMAGTFEWTLEPFGIRISESPFGSTPARDNAATWNESTESTPSRTSVIDSFGTEPSVSPIDTVRRRSGVVNPAPRWINDPTSSSWRPSPSSALVNLSIGTERAAQIHPARSVRQNPPQDCVSENPTPTVGDAATDTPDTRTALAPAPAPIPKPASTSSQKPVRRTLGGNWSYLSAAPNPNLRRTSTRRPRKRPDEVKSGARKENPRADRGSIEQRCAAPQPGESFLPRARPKLTRTLSDPSSSIPTTYRGLPTFNTETSEAALPVLPENRREEADDMTTTPPTSDTRPTAQTSESEVANGAMELDETELYEMELDELDEMDEVVLVPSGPSA